MSIFAARYFKLLLKTLIKYTFEHFLKRLNSKMIFRFPSPLVFRVFSAKSTFRKFFVWSLKMDGQVDSEGTTGIMTSSSS